MSSQGETELRPLVEQSEGELLEEVKQTHVFARVSPNMAPGAQSGSHSGATTRPASITSRKARSPALGSGQHGEKAGYSTFERRENKGYLRERKIQPLNQPGAF